MTHRQMSCKSLVIDSTDEGTIDKIVSVFGNVDYAGDRVNQGAFAKSLERWATSDGPIPVIFSHQWNVLECHVGVVEDAKELAPNDPLLVESAPQLAALGGLWVRERYDMDEPFAARLYQLQKQRRIKESSFAYDVLREKRAGDGVNDLLELDIIEVGPTLKGMNPETVVIDAKTRDAAARATGSAKADDGDDGGSSEDTHVPPQKVQDNAQAALDAIENGDAGEGFTETGQARAEQLAGGEALPLSDIREMSAWFARHEGDEGREEQGTPAWVAWMAWGGDEGREWADGIVADADEETEDESQSDGGSGTSSRPPERKARVTLDGSYEQLQERLQAAIATWSEATYGVYELWAALLEATYADHAIVYVELWSQPYGGGDYHQVTYTVADDGAVTLGEPVPVEITGVVAPKGLPQHLRDRKAAAMAHAAKSDAAPAAPTHSPDGVLLELAIAELDT